jgi:hypothetical protein
MRVPGLFTGSGRFGPEAARSVRSRPELPSTAERSADIRTQLLFPFFSRNEENAKLCKSSVQLLRN